MCHTSPLFYVSHQSTFKGNGDFNVPWVTKAWEDSIKWVSNCGLGGSLVKNLYLIFCLWANTLSILSPVTKILKHFQISSPHSLIAMLTNCFPLHAGMLPMDCVWLMTGAYLEVSHCGLPTFSCTCLQVWENNHLSAFVWVKRNMGTA